MSDLAGFLLARIAGDEAVARAANGPHWRSGDGNISEGGLYVLDGDGTDETAGWAIAWFTLGQTNRAEDGSKQLPTFSSLELHAHANSVHAARHDPARVLAECEAKRRIVERAVDTQRHAARSWDDEYAGEASGLAVALTYLALPYADHPDYDPGWQ